MKAARISGLGRAAIGAFLKPSSPTFSTYFFGTTEAVPDALVS